MVVFITASTMLSTIILWSMSMHYTDKQWIILYEEVSKGCANPDNNLATISIVLNHDQAWSCTPYYKQHRPVRAKVKPGKLGKAGKGKKK